MSNILNSMEEQEEINGELSMEDKIEMLIHHVARLEIVAESLIEKHNSVIERLEELEDSEDE